MWGYELQEVLFQIRKLVDESERFQGKGEIMVAVLYSSRISRFCFSKKAETTKKEDEGME